MKKNTAKSINQQGSAQVIVLGLLILIASAAGAIYYLPKSDLFNRPPSSSIPDPTINLSQQPITFDFISNGVLTIDNLDNSRDLKQKTILADGSIQYTLRSSLRTRDSIVIVKGPSVIYSRIITIGHDSSAPKITTYLKQYGVAEKVYRGSKYFGPLASLYLNATRGYALIGNSQTDEMFEVHTFPKMTIDEYFSKFGEDFIVGPDKLTEVL